MSFTKENVNAYVPVLQTSLGATLQQVDKQKLDFSMSRSLGQRLPCAGKEQPMESFVIAFLRMLLCERLCRSSLWGCQIWLWFHSASVAPDPSESSQPKRNRGGNMTSRLKASISSSPLCVCVCVFNEVMDRYMLLRCFMFPTMICSLFSNQSFTVSHRNAFGVSN